MKLVAVIFAFLKELFGFGAAVSTEVAQRDGELNTADERSNAEAAQVQADKDKARAEIAKGDDAALGRDVAP